MVCSVPGCVDGFPCSLPCTVCVQSSVRQTLLYWCVSSVEGTAGLAELGFAEALH